MGSTYYVLRSWKLLGYSSWSGKQMGITGTNADGSLTLWLSFEPSPGHLKPQHHLMVAGDPEEGMEMYVKGPTVSEHPRTLGRTLWHPEIRPSPALLLQPQGGMASSHERVLLFLKYVCCINTVIKGSQVSVMVGL